MHKLLKTVKQEPSFLIVSFCPYSPTIIAIAFLDLSPALYHFSIYPFFKSSFSIIIFYNVSQQILSKMRVWIAYQSVRLSPQNLKVGQVPLFLERDGKVQPMEDEDIADLTDLDENIPGLPCSQPGSGWQSNDKLNLVVVCTVQDFDIYQTFPYPNPIHGPEHPLTTFDEFMFPQYYLWVPRRCARTVTPTAPPTGSTA